MRNNKDWKKTKTIYWSDELNDDFDEILKERPKVPKNYRYIRRFHVLAWIAYYLIAKPILGIFCFFHGIRVKGKKNLRPLKKTGYFLYSNHVAIADVFKFAAYAIGRKRVNIIGYSDALSLKPIRPLIKALGLLPIPTDIDNLKKLKDAIHHYINEKEIILIYPEAHIWPYYTHIRNFKDVSFTYPAEMNKPVVPAVTIWRGKEGRKPKQTIIFCKPIYPNPELTPYENKKFLHEQCLLEMKEVSDKYPQVEYIKYIRVEE